MIYLDNAATTFPKPPGVYEKTIAFLQEWGGNPGRGSHGFAAAAGLMVEKARRAVARLFDVSDPRRVIFTYNCTDSINMVLKGFLHPGDHVLACNLDHNAVSRPLQRLQIENRIRVTRLSFDEKGEPESYAGHNTKFIVFTHGSNVLGTVVPLERLPDTPVLIDAAQTAGRIPIRIGNHPWFLACSGHKGLFGMQGVGILIVPSDLPLGKWREGGTGSFSESLHHPDELPARLEAGTPAVPAIVSLLYGIEFIEKTGMEKIHRKEMDLAQMLRNGLQEDDRFLLYTPVTFDLPIVAFNIKNLSPEEAAAILDQKYGIAVRAGLHCAAVLHEQLGTTPLGGCLRISPGYFNTESDIEATLSALKEIAKAY